MEKPEMKKPELDVEFVQDVIFGLAQSQGFYGRLARSLDEGDAWQALTDALNERGCRDALDIVMALEG